MSIDYGMTPTTGGDLDTESFNSLPRLEQCKKIYGDWLGRYANWVTEAKRSNTYLRGTHFLATLARDQVDPDDYMPEDRHSSGSDEKTYPSIPYTLSLIDRLCQYIRHDEGDILVTAEGQYAFDHIDPRLQEFGATADMDMSQAEMVGKMLTARLDLYSDRSGVKQKLDEVAHVAAAQRVSFVVVSWIDDETTEEPVKTDIISAGKYWFDPNASSIDDAKYAGYKETVDKETLVRRYSKDISSEKTAIEVSHCYTRDYTTHEVEGETIYKYPSAWRHTVYTKSMILYDGEMKTPGTKPPICIFTWRPLPNSMIGISVMDATKTINNNIDRALQYIMESAYRGLPKTAVDKSQVDDPDILDENDTQAYLFFDSTKAKSNGAAYTYIQGAPIPDSLYTLLNELKSLGAEMCGADGVQMEDATKFKLSGDAIEGIAQDRNGIAGRIRDTWYLFLTNYYELVIRFIMSNEVDEVNLTIPTPNGEMQVTTQMDMYQFNDADFETYFDVSVFSPDNMPKNPVKRSQYFLQMLAQVKELADSDPTLARIYVDMSDLPNKAELIEYLNARSKEAEQMQMMQADQGMVSAESELKQRENRERMAADTAKSVSDGLESLAKEQSKDNPQMALEILASIPQQANNAYNQVMQGQTDTWTQQQTIQ